MLQRGSGWQAVHGHDPMPGVDGPLLALPEDRRRIGLAQARAVGRQQAAQLEVGERPTAGDLPGVRPAGAGVRSRACLRGGAAQRAGRIPTRFGEGECVWDIVRSFREVPVWLQAYQNTIALRRRTSRSGDVWPGEDCGCCLGPHRAFFWTQELGVFYVTSISSPLSCASGAGGPDDGTRPSRVAASSRIRHAPWRGRGTNLDPTRH